LRKRLGLIAGSGRLPFEVLAGARENGVETTVVAIERNTDPALEGHGGGPLHWIAPGELGRLLALLQQAGADHAILAGAVSRRELLRDPASLRPDARALALLGRLRERGDDALLRAVAGEIEAEGIPVVSSTLYLASRLVTPGVLGGPEPPAAVLADLALGLRVARTLGVHDVGQTVVVKDGTVLALEAVEGTDATIRRGASLGGPGAVVVKAAKPGQDLRFDVPAVGPGTVDLALECGVRAIGMEAGRTIVLDRDAALARAAAGGVTLVGLDGAAS
jgi:DUF1009 family protein